MSDTKKERSPALKYSDSFDPLEQFRDHFTKEVSWCGECGYPCEPVRPGKAQCHMCETRLLNDLLLAERDKLKERCNWLQSRFSSTVNDSQNTLESVEALGDE